MSQSTRMAIPAGTIYPDGLPITVPDADVQRSVRPEGSFFVKSVGFETIRPGRTKFQHSHGAGIHFTPTRFAEDLSQPGKLPLMVDVTTAADHVDVADIPGSELLGPFGDVHQDHRVLASEGTQMAPTGGHVAHRGTKTLPDMGDREPHRPLSQIFHGMADPVELFQSEYKRNPLVALGAAGVVITVAYLIARDFEQSYRSRSASARGSGGAAAAAAPVAAGTAAAADTSGNVVVKAADTAASVVEAGADAVENVTETVADAVAKD